jgi:hypothetical protein
MIPTAPQIGFDRFIQLDWVAASLKVRSGMAHPDALNELLDAAGLGVAARKKTHTILNRLWLAPRPALADFADRGIEIHRNSADVSIAALTWGMAIATYPFFGKVAELVGRLSALQGDCASAELHRRMSELYGERQGTSRMTNMVLQSQVSWGTLERVEKGRRLMRKAAISITDDQALAWLVEAALHYIGKAMPVATLQSTAVLYPFLLAQPIGYVASNSPMLELRSEGTGNLLVALRATL